MIGSRSLITELAELMIRVRAGYRCEYCYTDLQGQDYELDHINPRSLGGADDEANLALACRRCNRNKGDRTMYVDPHTKRAVTLYNPRLDNWTEHFSVLSDGEVTGQTEKGRATAALLFRRTRRFTPPDLSWDKIEGLQRSEYVYRFLNDLRFRRLHNQFELLEQALRIPLSSFEASKPDLQNAEAAKELLRLEMHFTRSTPKDVDQGIRVGERLLRRIHGSLENELRTILSVLYQQRATIKHLAGDRSGAAADHQRAIRIFELRAIDQATSAWRTRSTFREHLRTLALHGKYDSLHVGRAELSSLLDAAIDLNDEADVRHLVYLTDIILSDASDKIRMLEAVYSVLTELVESGGYGQTIDRARFVTLRRRWWILHLMLESDPWLEALAADVAYWRSISMHNEARELRLAVLHRVAGIAPKVATDAQGVIDRHSQ
jgi:hypothetical protein